MNREGKKAHLTKTDRRIITFQEWAYVLGVSRLKVSKLVEEYQNIGGNYNPKDIYSVLTFYRYILLSTPILKRMI